MKDPSEVVNFCEIEYGNTSCWFMLVPACVGVFRTLLPPPWFVALDSSASSSSDVQNPELISCHFSFRNVMEWSLCRDRAVPGCGLAEIVIPTRRLFDL